MNKLISSVFSLLLIVLAVPIIVLSFIGAIIGAIFKVIAIIAESPIKLLQAIARQIEREVDILTDKNKEDK